MPRSRAAFTLIELLVVIAIIAILAAILFPVFAQARERARQISCVSNMKQLGLAVMMYAQDYDETYPLTANYGVAPDPTIWPEALQPYIKNQGVFNCPSASGAGYAVNWAQRGYASIGMTGQLAFDPLAAEGFTSAATIASMDEVARTPLFADTANAKIGGALGKYRGHNFDPCTPDSTGNRPANALDPRLVPPLVSDRDLVQELGATLPAGRLKPVFARHFRTGRDTGSTSIIFGDGHVKSYSASSILGQEKGANLLWRFRGCPTP
jgi:prepilin-type N-terminal cleavage/methylation domain-containing protein